MKVDDFISDEQKFQEWLKKHKLEKQRVYLVCLGGIGDHFVAKKVILKLAPKLQKYKLVVGAVYLDVFWDFDENIKIVPLDFIKNKISEIEGFNVYSWMSKHSWDKSIEEAYENMFKELLYHQSILV